MNRAEAHVRTGRPTVTAEQVTAALTELGSSAEAIADRLRALEIKGTRGDACECPIAVYLHRRFGIRAVVSSGPGSTVDWRSGPGWHAICTPMPIVDFIGRHDRGVYLDLVPTTTSEVPR